MKVLLIFPPQTLEERYAHKVDDIGGFLPPLGLCYMAAVLEREDHEVRIMDCPVNNYGTEDIVNEITDFQPDLIGIATITSLADVIVELCNLIKNQFPDITVLLGGPHATIMAHDLAKTTKADIIVQEEADNIIIDIVNNLEKYKQMKVVNAGKVKNLESLPFPARHLLDMSKYTSLPNTYKKDPHTFQMVTSRGCPFTCTFCFDAKGLFRQRGVENVMAEIRQLKDTYKIKEIAFWDDILTINKKWTYDFCLEMEKENIVWSCYTRLDLIDELMLRAMKKVGIEIRGSFMLGLPGETPELARKTIQLAIEMNPDYAQFSITTPYPGTQLWDTYEKWGTLDKNFKDYHGWSSVHHFS